MELLDVPEIGPAQANQPPADLPFVKKRKTHANDTIIALFRGLSRPKKLEYNRLISARNDQRVLGRAYRHENPARNVDGERYSSDESFITISEEDAGPPSASQHVCDFLSAMWPKAASSWFKKLLKRTHSAADSEDDLAGDSSAIQKAKRHNAGLKEEVKVKPGDTHIPGFSNILYALYASDVYIPISLFTTSNLRVLARDGNSLPFRKVNEGGLSGKQARVLDVAEFEKKNGSEKDLTHVEWTEAVGNYLRFTQSFDNEKWSSRWFEHFKYLESREDCIPNFKAIKLVDIKLRKDYCVGPFAFSKPFYNDQIQLQIGELRDAKTANLKLTLSRFDRSGAPFQPSTSRFSRLRAFAGQSSSMQPSSSRPFQARTGGDPSAAVCVICAKKGHVFSNCPSSTFDDRKPLFCKVEDGNLVSIKGKTSICRSWNLRSSDSTACGNHPKDKCAHICSFCGDGTHHAFSWACRQDPSKPSA
jgi:hypothetical protein